MRGHPVGQAMLTCRSVGVPFRFCSTATVAEPEYTKSICSQPSPALHNKQPKPGSANIQPFAVVSRSGSTLTLEPVHALVRHSKSGTAQASLNVSQAFQ